MARAAGVVAMGGYNTFCEILSFDKRALIVPRTAPRLEQFIRTKRAAELGLLRLLSEHEGRDPRVMAAALRRLPQQPPPSAVLIPGPARRHARGQPPRPELARPGAGRLLCGAGALRNLSVAAPSAAAGRVAFVLKGYPRLSETFIAQEILALERRGLEILIVSLRHPTDRTIHPVHRLIRAALLYLPEYLYQEPGRVWRGWLRSRRRPGYRRPRAAWLADLRRDPTPNRVRRFGQALVLAAELPDGIDRLHAHFLHTPASVARYAAMIAGLGWSVSAHAKDIWTLPEWEKRDKARRSGLGRDLHRAARIAIWRAWPRARLRRALLPRARPRERFEPPPPRVRAPRRHRPDDSRSSFSRSGGRLRKRATTTCSSTRASARGSRMALCPYRRRRARCRAEGAGGAPRSVASGSSGGAPGAQPEVLAAYREADLFVLASKIAQDGDRTACPMF